MLEKNFLLVGNGAREHALAAAICRDKAVHLFAYMSAKNPGISALCGLSGGEFAIGDIHSPAEVCEFAKSKKISLAFSSPDATLQSGVSDALMQSQIPCASPTKAASRIEWDKSFARELMRKHKIPGNPKFKVCSDAKEASAFIDSLSGNVAIKPAGLTGGKGVKVVGVQLKDGEEAKKYAKEILGSGMGGIPSVVIEEKLVGEEFTLQAFSDGKTIVPMPLVQDHKLAFAGDTGPNCYSSDTEILTENGWKTFDKLSKSERVGVFQARFKRIRFEKPKKTYWMKYKGEMVSFKHREIDLLVTPNHRMLVQERKGNRKFHVVEAKDWVGERFVLQTGNWIGISKRYMRIPKSKNNYGVKKKSINIKFADWAEFLGLFLSEGFCTHGRVYVCQVKKSKHFSRMHAILRKLPFNIFIEKNGFRINSVQLADYLSQFGHAHEKFVPSEIKNSKPEIINSFLSAFCLGDGDIHRGQMRLCSSSKRLISDLQELFMKTGSVGVITVDKRTRMLNPINKKYYPARPIYAIEVKKKNKTSIRKNNIHAVDYDGYVGCVNVSTGFVIVRRNYRIAICGNTGGMGSYSDSSHLLPFISQKDYDFAVSIMQKTVQALAQEKNSFVGVLYGQFIATKDGIKVIEFNARFGDPEAMNVLSILEGDLYSIFESMAKGTLANAKISFAKKATVCKYLVPQGYPETSEADLPLNINWGGVSSAGAKLYFASVYEKLGKIYTQKSRSIGVLAVADSIAEAEKAAEKGCSCVSGQLRHRKDIGTKALLNKKIERMVKMRS